MKEHDFSSGELRDIDEAIDMIEDDIARARKYFRHERYEDAKKELDELIQNVKAWKENYEP